MTNARKLSNLVSAIGIYSDEAISTTEIAEGDNLYYTTSRANSAIDTRVSNTYINSLAIDASTLKSGNTTNGRVLTANGLGGAVWETVAGVISDFQEFTTSGTWTKPEGATWVYVEAIGGGGGGGNHTSTTGTSGGGGGGFTTGVFRASELTETITCTIGAGGTGAANGSSAYGNDGGQTTFGSLLFANGGMGGFSGSPNMFSSKSAFGGGGECPIGFGTTTNWIGSGSYSSGSGGGNGFKGGDCVMGGAGGGGAGSSIGGDGGVSARGGNGGNGSATASTKADNGTAPGGAGGGSTNNGGGGDGADGRIRVWSW